MRRRPALLRLVVPMVFAVLLLGPGRIWAGQSRPVGGPIPAGRGATRPDGGGPGSAAPAP